MLESFEMFFIDVAPRFLIAAIHNALSYSNFTLFAAKHLKPMDCWSLQARHIFEKRSLITSNTFH